jgi:hypothetical protein
MAFQQEDKLLLKQKSPPPLKKWETFLIRLNQLGSPENAVLRGKIYHILNIRFIG